MNTEKKNEKPSSEEIKAEPAKDDPIHKGYNEKNPEQPQGAFKPDSKTDTIDQSKNK